MLPVEVSDMVKGKVERSSPITIERRVSHYRPDDPTEHIVYSIILWENGCRRIRRHKRDRVPHSQPIDFDATLSELNSQPPSLGEGGHNHGIH